MEPQQTPNSTPQAPSTGSPTVAAPPTVLSPMNYQPVINTVWSKTIKTVNYITLVISLGFLLAIDLPILVQSPPLAPFFFVMLAAFGLFVGCLLFELWAGKRLRDTTRSGLDTIVLVLAIIRNVIIVLNVIPLIQLIGLLTFPLALLFILANAIMIKIRLRQSAPTIPTAV